MTKIFFDHQKFSTQKYGGISRYFANIIQEIKHIPDFDYLLGLLYSKNHYLKDEPQMLNNFIGNTFLQSKYNQRTIKANEFYCKQLLKKNQFDIFHPTYYDGYFLDILKKPLVITIHDMTHERLPAHFWAEDPLTHNKRLNVERADRIIAISETTKNDLIKYSDVDPAKIQVIYHGIDIEAPFVSHEVPGLPKNYLLFVGDRSGYKNFYVFMEAFAVISKKNPDLHVVLTGGGPIGIADKEYMHRLKITDKISHVNVSDEGLNYLYEKALAFVYPSLHEGFGLPILEAYKAKCPMILSDTECFREIALDTALFFDAYSIEHLVTVLQQMIDDSGLRKELVAKGTKHLYDFPMKKSVDETLDVYRSLM